MLHSAAIERAVDFDWLDKPETAAVETAENLLHSLGALTKRSEGLTEIATVSDLYISDHLSRPGSGPEPCWLPFRKIQAFSESLQRRPQVGPQRQ